MRIVGVIGASILLAACHADRSGEYSGVVEIREIQVGSKVGGRVVDVLAAEGQQVQGGAPLVRFDAAELQATRRQLLARIAEAEADVARLRRGYRPEEIRQAEANAERERAVLEALQRGPRTQEIQQADADYRAAAADAGNAERNYQRIEQLHASGDISAQARDDARARYDASRDRAEASRQRLALLQAGTRAEDIRAGEARYRQALASAQLMKRGYRVEEVAAGEARLQEAKALLEETDVRLREMDIRAPDTCGVRGCLVETVGVRPGDLIPAGKAVSTLLEPTQLWVRIYVPEPELGAIKVGQSATVRVDTFPGRDFSGSVEQIASRAEFLPRNVQTRDDRNHQVFGVKVRVDNSSGALKSGMAATVRLNPAQAERPGS